MTTNYIVACIDNFSPSNNNYTAMHISSPNNIISDA